MKNSKKEKFAIIFFLIIALFGLFVVLEGSAIIQSHRKTLIKLDIKPEIGDEYYFPITYSVYNGSITKFENVKIVNIENDIIYFTFEDESFECNYNDFRKKAKIHPSTSVVI